MEKTLSVLSEREERPSGAPKQPVTRSDVILNGGSGGWVEHRPAGERVGVGRGRRRLPQWCRQEPDAWARVGAGRRGEVRSRGASEDSSEKVGERAESR